MNMTFPWIELAVALGAGLLIGIERERRKGRGARRAMAGVRTFTLTALGGALAQLLAEPWLVVTGGVLLTGLIWLGYRAEQRAQHNAPRSNYDPGVTTEIALFSTYLLGVLAVQRPAWAAAAAVVITILLAARTRLHHFSTHILTVQEIHDALLLAAAVLLILPLLPNENLALLGGVNPRRLWWLAVMMMLLQALGYIAVRVVGGRFGLPFAGLASGFVSSTATIAAMGARARSEPQWRDACVLAGWMSCLATNVQIAVVTITIRPAALPTLATLLISSSCVVLVLSALAWRSLLQQSQPAPHTLPQGRALSLRHALVFATLLSVFTAVGHWAVRVWGEVGLWWAAILAGLVDVHAAIASVLSAGTLSESALVAAVLLAYSANTLSKCVIAWVTGGRAYAWRAIGGLVLIASGAWASIIL